MMNSQTSASVPLNEISVESWLGRLEQASRIATSGSIQQLPENAQYCLLYVLIPEDQGGQQVLKVMSQKVRLLKKGGYVKPSKYALEKVRGSYADRFLLSTDKDIAYLLVESSAYYYYDYENIYLLKGEIGELALRKILSTGRCFWQDNDKSPMSLGATRDIEFVWQKESAGQSLQYIIDPSVNHIFRFTAVPLRSKKQGLKTHLFWYNEIVKSHYKTRRSTGLESS